VWFQVAMDVPAFMKRFETFKNVADDFKCTLFGHRPFHIEKRFQIPARQVIHNEAQATSDPHESMDADDERALDRLQGGKFAEETAARFIMFR